MVWITRCSYLILLGQLGLISSHSYNLGKCPQFSPMKEFDWDKFSNGTWYVIEKTSTSGRCLTETFMKDENGFKSVRQTSQSPISRSVGLNEETVSIGELSQPEVYTRPANMVVKFPLNMIGPSSFVIVFTDYNTTALTCTCQDVGLIGLVYVNRRSCTILQRSTSDDDDILQKMESLILEQKHMTKHDLDHLNKIDHKLCKYGDRPLTINYNDIEKSIQF